ncbi:hypothetical protein C4D60_Mb05t21780 [Musa balbisiana]|uniref:Uncharacterized protein n=1 Tax=Musa balbisiana TaxID=52838 RepID=A0A4V4H8C4_MUSBA|nr:hypothetical protein C4D60_Mb05t21780 [Musa balbisiana]
MQQRSAAVGDGWLGFLLLHGCRFQYVYVAAISLQTGSDGCHGRLFHSSVAIAGYTLVAKDISRLGVPLAPQFTCRLSVKWFGIVWCYYLHYARSLRAFLRFGFSWIHFSCNWKIRFYQNISDIAYYELVEFGCTLIGKLTPF